MFTLASVMIEVTFVIVSSGHTLDNDADCLMDMDVPRSANSKYLHFKISKLNLFSFLGMILFVGLKYITIKYIRV